MGSEGQRQKVISSMSCHSQETAPETEVERHSSAFVSPTHGHAGVGLGGIIHVFSKRDSALALSHSISQVTETSSMADSKSFFDSFKSWSTSDRYHNGSVEASQATRANLACSDTCSSTKPLQFSLPLSSHNTLLLLLSPITQSFDFGQLHTVI